MAIYEELLSEDELLRKRIREHKFVDYDKLPSAKKISPKKPFVGPVNRPKPVPQVDKGITINTKDFQPTKPKTHEERVHELVVEIARGEIDPNKDYSLLEDDPKYGKLYEGFNSKIDEYYNGRRDPNIIKSLSDKAFSLLPQDSKDFLVGEREATEVALGVTPINKADTTNPGFKKKIAEIGGDTEEEATARRVSKNYDKNRVTKNAPEVVANMVMGANALIPAVGKSIVNVAGQIGTTGTAIADAPETEKKIIEWQTETGNKIVKSSPSLEALPEVGVIGDLATNTALSVVVGGVVGQIARGIPVVSGYINSSETARKTYNAIENGIQASVQTFVPTYNANLQAGMSREEAAESAMTLAVNSGIINGAFGFAMKDGQSNKQIIMNAALQGASNYADSVMVGGDEKANIQALVMGFMLPMVHGMKLKGTKKPKVLPSQMEGVERPENLFQVVKPKDNNMDVANKENMELRNEFINGKPAEGTVVDGDVSTTDNEFVNKEGIPDKIPQSKLDSFIGEDDAVMVKGGREPGYIDGEVVVDYEGKYLGEKSDIVTVVKYDNNGDAISVTDVVPDSSYIDTTNVDTAHIDEIINKPVEDVNLKVDSEDLIISFKTEKGSVYTINEDGTTIRNKSYHPEHGAEDVGIQPSSSKTYYVTVEDGNILSEVQTKGSKKTIGEVVDGDIAVVYLDGKSAGKAERRTKVTPKLKPEVGLLPVEVFDNGFVHFGNKITELNPIDSKDLNTSHIDEVINDIDTIRDIETVDTSHIDEVVNKDEVTKPAIEPQLDMVAKKQDNIDNETTREKKKKEAKDNIAKILPKLANEISKTTNMGIPTSTESMRLTKDLVVNLVKLGSYGLQDFGDYVARSVKEFGEGVRVYLKTAWNEIQFKESFFQVDRVIEENSNLKPNQLLQKIKGDTTIKKGEKDILHLEELEDIKDLTIDMIKNHVRQNQYDLEIVGNQTIESINRQKELDAELEQLSNKIDNIDKHIINVIKSEKFSDKHENLKNEKSSYVKRANEIYEEKRKYYIIEYFKGRSWDKGKDYRVIFVRAKKHNAIGYPDHVMRSLKIDFGYTEEGMKFINDGFKTLTEDQYNKAFNDFVDKKGNKELLSWKDNHDVFAGINNPVVHFRVTDIPNKNNGYDLFVQEIQNSTTRDNFLNKNWINIGVKKLIYIAKKGGYDNIIWINGKQINGGTVRGDRDLSNLYNDIVVSEMRRITGNEPGEIDLNLVNSSGENTGLSHIVKVNPSNATEVSNNVKVAIERLKNFDYKDDGSLGMNGGKLVSDIIDDLITVGIHGAKTFGEYVRKSVKAFGEKVRPYLKEAWNNLQKSIKETDKKLYDKFVSPHVESLSKSIENAQKRIQDIEMNIYKSSEKDFANRRANQFALDHHQEELGEFFERISNLEKNKDSFVLSMKDWSKENSINIQNKIFDAFERLASKYDYTVLKTQGESPKTGNKTLDKDVMDIYNDLITIGNHGAKTAGEYIRKSVNLLGEKIRPALRTAWNILKSGFEAPFWFMMGASGGNPYGPKREVKITANDLDAVRDFFKPGMDFADFKKAIPEGTKNANALLKALTEEHRLNEEAAKNARQVETDEELKRQQDEIDNQMAMKTRSEDEIDDEPINKKPIDKKPVDNKDTKPVNETEDEPEIDNYNTISDKVRVKKTDIGKNILVFADPVNTSNIHTVKSGLADYIIDNNITGDTPDNLKLALMRHINEYFRGGLNDFVKNDILDNIDNVNHRDIFKDVEAKRRTIAYNEANKTLDITDIVDLNDVKVSKSNPLVTDLITLTGDVSNIRLQDYARTHQIRTLPDFIRHIDEAINKLINNGLDPIKGDVLKNELKMKVRDGGQSVLFHDDSVINEAYSVISEELLGNIKPLSVSLHVEGEGDLTDDHYYVVQNDALRDMKIAQFKQKYNNDDFDAANAAFKLIIKGRAIDIHFEIALDWALRNSTSDDDLIYSQSQLIRDVIARTMKDKGQCIQILRRVYDKNAVQKLIREVNNATNNPGHVNLENTHAEIGKVIDNIVSDLESVKNGEVTDLEKKQAQRLKSIRKYSAMIAVQSKRLHEVRMQLLHLSLGNNDTGIVGERGTPWTKEAVEDVMRRIDQTKTLILQIDNLVESGTITKETGQLIKDRLSLSQSIGEEIVKTSQKMNEVIEKSSDKTYTEKQYNDLIRIHNDNIKKLKKKIQNEFTSNEEYDKVFNELQTVKGVNKNYLATITKLKEESALYGRRVVTDLQERLRDVLLELKERGKNDDETFAQIHELETRIEELQSLLDGKVPEGKVKKGKKNVDNSSVIDSSLLLSDEEVKITKLMLNEITKDLEDHKKMLAESEKNREADAEKVKQASAEMKKMASTIKRMTGNIEKHKNTIAELTAKINDKGSSVTPEELSGIIDAFNGQIKTHKDEITNLEKTVKSLQKKVKETAKSKELLAQIESLKNDLVAHQALIDSLNKTISLDAKNTKKLNKTIKDMSKSMSDIQDKLNQANEQIGLLSEDKQATIDYHGLVDMDKELTTSLETIGNMTNDINDKNNVISSLEGLNESYVADIKNYQTTIDGMRVDIDNLNNVKDYLQSSVEKLHGLLKNVNNVNAENNKIIEEYKNKIAYIESIIKAKDFEISELNRRIQVHEDFIADIKRITGIDDTNGVPLTEQLATNIISDMAEIAAIQDHVSDLESRTDKYEAILYDYDTKLNSQQDDLNFNVEQISSDISNDDNVFNLNSDIEARNAELNSYVDDQPEVLRAIEEQTIIKEIMGEYMKDNNFNFGNVAHSRYNDGVDKIRHFYSWIDDNFSPGQASRLKDIVAKRISNSLDRYVSQVVPEDKIKQEMAKADNLKKFFESGVLNHILDSINTGRNISNNRPYDNSTFENAQRYMFDKLAGINTRPKTRAEGKKAHQLWIDIIHNNTPDNYKSAFCDAIESRLNNIFDNLEFAKRELPEFKDIVGMKDGQGDVTQLRITDVNGDIITIDRNATTQTFRQLAERIYEAYRESAAMKIIGVKHEKPKTVNSDITDSKKKAHLFNLFRAGGLLKDDASGILSKSLRKVLGVSSINMPSFYSAMKTIDVVQRSITNNDDIDTILNHIRNAKGYTGNNIMNEHALNIVREYFLEADGNSHRVTFAKERVLHALLQDVIDDVQRHNSTYNWHDVALKAGIGNMLSGASTQLMNITGTGMSTANYVAIQIGNVLTDKLFRGNRQGREWKEISALARDQKLIYHLAAQKFALALQGITDLGIRPIDMPSINMEKVGNDTPIGRMFNKTLGRGYRTLEKFALACDSFWREINYQSSKSMIDERREGLSEEIRRDIELLQTQEGTLASYNGVIANRLMNKIAQVFNYKENKPGTILHGTRPAKWLMFFGRMAIKLADQAYKNTPGLGLLDLTALSNDMPAHIKEEIKQTIFTRQMLSVVTAMTVGALTQISLGGKEEEHKYSIKLGNRWVPYGSLPMIAPAILMAGVYQKAMKDKSMENVFSNIASGLGTVVVNSFQLKRGFSALDPFLNSSSQYNPEAKKKLYETTAAKSVASLLKSMILPFSGAQRDLFNGLDPYARAEKNSLHTMLNGTAFRYNLPKNYNDEGEVKRNPSYGFNIENGGINAISPFKQTVETITPFQKKLVDIGLDLPTFNKTFIEDGKKHTVDESIVNQYNKIQADRIKSRINNITPDKKSKINEQMKSIHDNIYDRFKYDAIKFNKSKNIQPTKVEK